MSGGPVAFCLTVHYFYLREGTLYCEEQDLSALAAQYGTPLYVYSASTIRDNFCRLDAAFSPLSHLICYAVKANSNLSILHFLAKLGSAFDIVSGGELYRVLKAGGRADRCVFAGVGKTRQEIEYAIEQGIYCFNVECEAELEMIDQIAGSLGKKAPIAVRINPDVDARTHRYISTGKTHNKFGIGMDRAEEVYSHAARLPNLQIRGVQTHIGSQILSSQPFVEAIRKLLPFVKRLKEEFELEFFSVGGGLGIVYAEALESGSPQWWKEASPSPLTFEEYAAELLPLLAPLGLKILFEPGRSLVGNAGALITQVIQIKKNPAKRFVIVDAGMNDLIRPALYEAFHQVIPLKASPSHPGDLADLVGPVCESGDFFLQDAALPELKPGDYLALMSTGAYGFVMSSHYNSRPLAAEVLVEGSRSFLIREREKWEDLIRGERTESA